MAVITNLNTTQTPLATGLTGAQAVRWIDAPRVYIRAADSTSTPCTTKSNGSTPVGTPTWTDLGIVEGKVKVTYQVERKEIRTGIDQVLRSAYAGQKTASLEFTLNQFDDVVIKELSGLTPSTITAGSVIQFAIGQGDVIQKAIMLVSQNKLDGKEWQFYHPNAFISFSIEDSGDATVVKGTGDLPAFTHGGADTLLVSTIYK